MQVAAMIILSVLIGSMCGAAVAVFTHMYMNNNKKE